MPHDAATALDRPVWSALAGRQASLAIGDGGALRLPAAIGPFAATRDASPAARAALVGLADAGDLWLLEPQPVVAPPGLVVVRTADVAQLVANAIDAPPPPAGMVALGEADAAAMHALATLTRPGPFGPETWRYGGFVGVREGGRLLAMAGRRLQPGGHVEASGVCTHPDARGRGLASALLGAVARGILRDGVRPMLHSYPDNHGAMALYRKLGFATRATLTVTILRRG